MLVFAVLLPNRTSADWLPHQSGAMRRHAHQSLSQVLQANASLHWEPRSQRHSVRGEMRDECHGQTAVQRGSFALDTPGAQVRLLDLQLSC